MSLRALRKLEKQRLEKQAESTPVTPEEEETEDFGPATNNKAFNAFDFLEDNEDNESDNEPEVQPEPIIAAPVPKKPSKKKNKKNKNKKAGTPKVDSDEELDKILEAAKLRDQQNRSKEQEEEPEEDEVVFDFEAEYNDIQEPFPSYDSNFKNFTTERLKQSLPLLSIKSVKNLDPEQELKNLFGNLSLDVIEDANTTTTITTSPQVLASYKRLARLTKGWGGRDRRSIPGTTQKLLMTRIKDDWFPTQIKNISMEELSLEEAVEYLDYKEDSAEHEDIETKVRKERKLGMKYFVFKKRMSSMETLANTQFFASVVMTPDPDSLFRILREQPYHVETLLQSSMVVLRQGNDKNASHGFVELGLFAFDRSLHKHFHELLSEAKNGLVRLPYESFMNRQFYLTLFRYIVGLAERSTFFTALTYCKLLLSLNPAEDPLGVRYFIDFYALMSEELTYLVQLSESPLVTSYTKWLTPGIAFSTVLAHLGLDNKEKAAEAMRAAYEAHPYTAFKLLEEIGLPSTMPVNESDIYTDDEVLLSTQTYLVRAKLLWNTTEKRKFLNDELTKLFLEDKNKGSAEPGTITSAIFGYFTGKKSKVPKPSHDIPYNLVRFAILSGESTVMAKVPETIWNRDDVYEYDVLPPTNETLSYGVAGAEQSLLVDSLLNYLNQDILANILQQNTQENFDQLMEQINDQAQAEEPQPEEL